jgi:hypothetical protein
VICGGNNYDNVINRRKIVMSPIPIINCTARRDVLMAILMMIQVFWSFIIYSQHDVTSQDNLHIYDLYSLLHISPLTQFLFHVIDKMICEQYIPRCQHYIIHPPYKAAWSTASTLHITFENNVQYGVLQPTTRPRLIIYPISSQVYY